MIYICSDIPRVPLDARMDDPNEDEDLIPPDERRPKRLLDSRRQADGELSDSDDEGEDDRRDSTSHRDPDSVGLSGSKRLAVGIMSTGSTHGIGPTVPQPVVATTATTSASSAAQSDMDVDDDEPPLAQTVRARAKARTSLSEGTAAMVVDSPPSSQPPDSAAPPPS